MEIDHQYGRSSFIRGPDPFSGESIETIAPAADTPTETVEESTEPQGDAPVAETSGNQEPEIQEPESQEQAQTDEESVQEAIETSSDVEAAPDTNDALTIEEAQEALRMLKESPEKFAQEHNVEFFGSRFTKLAKANAELRSKEKTLEQREIKAKVGEAFIEEMRGNPIAFAEKHIGKDLFYKWAEAIRDGKDTPAPAGIPDEINERLKALEEENNALKAKREEEETMAPVREKASRWISDAEKVSQDPLYAEMNEFYSQWFPAGKLMQDAVQVFGHFSRSGTELTAKDVLDRLLNVYNQKRGVKQSNTPNSEASVSQTVERASETPSGPGTLTNDVTTAVARTTAPAAPEGKNLSRAQQERAEMAAILSRVTSNS